MMDYLRLPTCVLPPREQDVGCVIAADEVAYGVLGMSLVYTFFFFLLPTLLNYSFILDTDMSFTFILHIDLYWFIFISVSVSVCNFVFISILIFSPAFFFFYWSV